jgi:hypothetical protein
MKKFIAALFGIFAALSLFGQTVIVRTVTANAVSNYLSGRYLIESLQYFGATSTNDSTTLKFYDWATAATNVVRAAYTSKNSYTTNYSTVYTNSAGIVSSNSFSGLYIADVSNSAVTNEQTRLATYQVPAGNAGTDLPSALQVARGLVLVSDQTGTIEITYRSAP